jgi:hypothetical protein
MYWIPSWIIEFAVVMLESGSGVDIVVLMGSLERVEVDSVVGTRGLISSEFVSVGNSSDTLLFKGKLDVLSNIPSTVEHGSGLGVGVGHVVSGESYP